MSVVSVAGITIDLCRGCQVAFFDHGELSQVCSSPAAFAKAMHPGYKRGRAGALVEAIVESPDAVNVVAHVGVEGARVAGEAEVVETAGSVALEAAEASAEASSAAAEVLLELLAGLFDGA